MLVVNMKRVTVKTEFAIVGEVRQGREVLLQVVMSREM